MSRGFLVGIGWGTVVAGLGLVVASQLTVSPQNMSGQLPASVVVANVPNAPETKTQVVDADTTAAMPPALPQDIAPDMTDALVDATAQPDAPMQTASVDPAITPDVLRADPQVTAPIVDGVSATMPEAQTQMAVPEAMPETAGVTAATPSVEAAPDATPADLMRAVEPMPESMAPDAAPNVEQTDSVADDAPEMGMTDESALVPIDPVSLPDTIVVVPDALPVTEDAATDVPTGEAAVEPATAVRPAPGFVGKVDGVKTGRLPSIGTGSTATPDVTNAAISLEVANADITGASPIERFARPFENADKKPMFAIVLQDTGGPSIDREALAAIPFPVSFMIDPMLPDAATAAQIYRAAGQEVLMIASGIPAGAQASDLAVSFEVMAKVLPEAVAVVDLEQGGFQGNRTLATQVLSLVKDQGRGVISWDRGLNAASQVARRDGIPEAMIFRALDGGDEGSPIIRRYLDRAAFKAAQDGRVIVAGQTRPETVAAILEWAVEGRAATVAIAPVTAVMTTQ